MEYQVKRAILACICDEILDPFFEIFLRDVFGLSKVVMLLQNQYDISKKDIFSHLLVVWHIRAAIILAFIDHKMSLFLDLLAIFPSNCTPTKLGDHRMIPVPSLKVACHPCANFVDPESASQFKSLASRFKSGIVCTLQTLVILIYFLIDGCQEWP